MIMDQAKIGRQLDGLVIFGNLRQDPLVRGLSGWLCASEEVEREASAAAVAAALYSEGVDLTKAILDRILKDDNFYVRERAAGRRPDSLIQAQLEAELDALSRAAAARPDPGTLPSWRSEATDFNACYEARMERVSVEGYGLFAAYRAFSMSSEGRLVPVLHPDPLRLSELYGYEEEREKVVRNTKALLTGLPASNILLYGDAGTGKSSTVKAVANEYFDRGLRLIQIEKKLLQTIPPLLDELAENPLKFILFIDDLSFASDDSHFTALKTVLEGSIAARSRNVVVYATSNRRHLINETFGDRRGDEVHLNDTLEEIASLSARFGMVVTFGKPGRDLFTALVLRLAEHSGLDLPEDVLIREAEAYAIRSGGRTPRAARQFVEFKIAMDSE